jgi:hypothetical protein
MHTVGVRRDETGPEKNLANKNAIKPTIRNSHGNFVQKPMTPLRFWSKI